MSGTTLVGDPPSILAGFTDSPGCRIASNSSARWAAAVMALRPSSGLRPGMRRAAVDGDREIAASGPRSGERSVGKAEGS